MLATPQFLFSSSFDKCVRQWDRTSGACVASYSDAARAVCGIALCDGFLFSASLDRVIYQHALCDHDKSICHATLEEHRIVDE